VNSYEELFRKRLYAAVTAALSNETVIVIVPANWWKSFAIRVMLNHLTDEQQRNARVAPEVINAVCREIFATIGLAYVLVNVVEYYYTGHWWPFS
jgi:hypothetical protein